MFAQMYRLKLRMSHVVLMLLVLFTGAAMSAEPVSKSRFRGVAIGGHDSVEYHNLNRDPQDQAATGVKTFSVKWKGATWRFQSQESAARFKAEPERFSPAYNGFCANALSLGKGLLKTDGTHWEIIGDQLYLFYAAAGRDRWIAIDDPAEYIKVADEEWARLAK